MTWRVNLRPASYRGAAFWLDSAESSIGRRIALHEYPLRDKPWAEDLGRAARRVSVDAIVIGDDYMSARDALLAAIETPGPGTLVHPYLGEIQVVPVELARVRESTAEGGLARISLSFVEAGEITYPSARTDSRAQVASRADMAQTIVTNEFAGRLSVSGQPAWVLGSMWSVLAAMFGRLEARPLARQTTAAATSTLVPSPATADGVPTITGPQAVSVALSVLAANIAAGDADAARDDTAPMVFAAIAGAWMGADPAQAIPVLVSLAEIGAPVQSAGSGIVTLAMPTPTRRAEQRNAEATAELIRMAVAVESARALKQVRFTSLDQALLLRDQVAAVLDAVIETTPDDAVMVAATELRVAVVADVATRGADLARIVRVTPSATQPAVVLAYTLYEDIDRATDIVVRNRIVRPGFVPAQPLEVLTDA